MAQTRLEHQKTWESLGGGPRVARPASSYISLQNHAAAQNVYAQQQQHHQQQQQGQQMNMPLHPTPSQSLQKRPVPYRQYPKAEMNSRPAHTNRVSTPPTPRTAYNVPSVLSVGQPRQPQQQQQAYTLQPQAQPAQYRHSLHPQALMPSYYQYQQNRHQLQQPPQPQPQLQNSRNGADSGYVDWTNAASRLSTMSASMTSPLEHVPCAGAGYDDSPLARVPSRRPVPAPAPAPAPARAPTLSHRASMILTPTHDARLCPEPLRVTRRPVSMCADATKLHRPELRISTQVAAPGVPRAMPTDAGMGARDDPQSACSYCSADYEDYMSPVLAAERRESSSNGSNGSSEFDVDLNEMLRAELELKLGLMSMGPIRSHLEAGGKLSAADAAGDPMLTAEWQRWREYLGEGADEE